MIKTIKNIVKENNLQLGKVKKMYKCSRGIRILGFGVKLGDIVEGFEEDGNDKWICIKVDKKDYNNNIMQKIKVE